MTYKDDQSVIDANRTAWDIQSSSQASRWVVPPSQAEMELARAGKPRLILTPNKAVPAGWYGLLKNSDVLGLASGGGQQMPMFAAAGANVASFDNSPEQLRRDQEVAQAHNLTLQTFQGDMADLSCFENERFDLIFHPVSNVFAPNIEPVWKECFRVLKPGGRLLAGFMNPCFYLFDHDAIESGGPLEVRFELPFSDVDQFSEEENRHRIEQGQALEFSHSLDDQIGGQLKAGFTLGGFYEDRWDNSATPLNQYMPTSMATLAIKPSTP